MNESEENKVTEQMRDPKVALMEMPNKRQPKVEATAVEQMDVGLVLEPRVAKQSPPSKGQQALSSEPSMPLAPVLISNITSSQPPCSPSSNENHQLSPESPTINGFFPATTRHIRQQSKLDNENQSDRDARYENKTSSDARGIREAESTSQPVSPLARVPDINVLEIPSSPNSHDLSPESKCVDTSTALHSMNDDNGKGLVR